MSIAELSAQREALRVLSQFWDLLSLDDQHLLEEHLSVCNYKKHEIIYSEGQRPDYLFCVINGNVKIYRDGVCGRSQIMRVLGRGDYFGYRASLAEEPYVTGAAAFGPSTICRIPMPLILDIMSHNNLVQQFFISELATDLGIADKRMVSLTQKHIRGRMAESILSLRDSFGIDAQGFINLPITREELACYSNMTTSNSIRTLSSFVKEGLIVVEGRKIKLLNDEELFHISYIG
jgi:CRP-like cAMP-binding protein